MMSMKQFKELKEKNREFEEGLGEIVKYENVQWKKAFLEGTDEAWTKYRRNVNRKITALEKAYKNYGFTVCRERIMG